MDGTGMDAYSSLLVAAIALFIGFVADHFFRRFKTPDVLILIIFGMALGPGALGLVDMDLASRISQVTPYVAAIALSIIMFQAGMGLHIRDVLTSFSRAMLQTVVAFIISLVATALICMAVLGWGPGEALLLASILGGTSGAIVIPLVCSLGVSARTRTVLTLESTITDVLVIASTMTLVAVMATGEANLGKAAVMILTAFLVSGFIGFVGGLLWLRILSRVAGQPFAYMITLAALLSVFAVAELAVERTGGGAVAALIFGLTLKNSDEFPQFLRDGIREYTCDAKIVNFHDEITFLVRTFFFVYLGLVLSVISLNVIHILLGSCIFTALVLGRYISAQLIGRYIAHLEKDQRALLFMMPRGLAAAVLASIPVSAGVVSTEVGNLILGTTAVVILLSTVLASAGALYIAHSSKRSDLLATIDGTGE